MAGRFNGTVYTGDGDDEKVAGKAASESILGAGGDDTLNGAGGDDTIEGGNGSDSILGGVGNDRIYGENVAFISSGLNAISSTAAHDDELTGGDGNDTIVGGYGRDTIDGGAGDDHVFLIYRYGDSASKPDVVSGGKGGIDSLSIHNGVKSVALDLPAGTIAIDGVLAARLTEFERLELDLSGDASHKIVAGDFDDVITVGNGDDSIVGGGGDDVIEARRGSDTVRAGAGDDEVSVSVLGKDLIDLGAGDDALMVDSQLLFGAAPKGAGVYRGGAGFDAIDLQLSNLSSEVAIAGGKLRLDGKVVASFDGFEAFSMQAVGGPVRFTGSDLAEAVRTGIGDDSISGGGGNDTISAGSGENTIDGGAGDDHLSVSVVEDLSIVRGGAGEDHLSVLGATARIEVVGDGDVVTAVKRDGKTVVEVSGVETFNFSGSQYGDLLLGGSGADSFLIGAGADTLRAGAGDDNVSLQLDGLLDRVDMGAGTDVVEFFDTSRTTPVELTVQKGVATVSLDGVAGARIENAEAFEFYTGSGDDKLTGGSGDDFFSAGRGANTISGGAGDDGVSVLIDDKLDKVSGGAGAFDSISVRYADGFAPGNAAVAVTVKGSTLTMKIGKATVLTADGYEALSISGGDGRDLLNGLSGPDALDGGLGRDTLNGGDGDDQITVGADGGDRINGGKGVDLVDFSATAGVEAELVKGKTVTAKVEGGANVALTNVEWLFGSAGDDTLTGDSGDNLIAGAPGSDLLDGGAGNDTLFIGGGESGVSIRLNGAKTIYVVDGTDRDTISNFENVIGGEANDTIIGDGGANRLDGNDGADILTGRGGADLFVAQTYDPETQKALDLVTDFSSSQGDKIDFAWVRPGEDPREKPDFEFIGKKAFSGEAGEIRFESGKSSFVYADADGDKIADYAMEFSGRIEFTRSDFLI